MSDELELYARRLETKIRQEVLSEEQADELLVKFINHRFGYLFEELQDE